MKYRDYIWDLGGTLLDNYEISTQAFVDTLKTFGKQASHDEVHSKLKESTDAAIARFIPDQPQFLKAYKEKEAELLESPILFPGAREVLQAIVADGGRNFLVSHRNKLVLDILKKTQLLPYFTEVVTSESGFARKRRQKTSEFYVRHEIERLRLPLFSAIFVSVFLEHVRENTADRKIGKRA